MFKLLIAAKRPFATAIALIVLIAGLFALNPSFPSGIALDNAWIMGLHEASGRSLAYGRDMIFTFGPYAAVYTREFHPATDHLMLFGSLFVTIGFVVAVLTVSRAAAWYWSAAFAYVICVLAYSRDAQLFAFTPLAVMTAASAIEGTDRSTRERYLFRAATLMTSSVLGILPLIKGSLLAPVFIAVVIGTFLLAKRISGRMATLYAVVPCVSLVIAWLLSGQTLADLPSYFSTQLQIISGFTDAMSSTGPAREWILYLIGSALCLSIAARNDATDRIASRAVLLMLAVFFFIAFKAGFVRHDGHAVTATSALLIGVVLSSTRSQTVKVVAPLLGAFVCWMALDASYANTSTRQVFVRTSSMFEGFTSGLATRIKDPSVFEASRTAQLSKLAEQCSIPKLEGTTDIYSFGQACLIAKRIAWSPRPVFQSYSAYTPKLAEINRQHLLGPTAPEHILFKVEPIDGRLPALEDGYSWPVLLNKYVLNGFQNEYLLLDKRTSSDPAQLPEFTALNSVSAEMGHPIEVPQQARTLIFASISVRPSMLGKLASVLFKPPQLNVRIGLANGSFKDYRYVARMAEKPILISPLVDTTRDFYLLANGNPAFIEGNRVVSIEIFAKNGASSAWNDAIEIQYFGLPSPPKSDAAAAAFDQPVTPWSGSAFNANANDWENCDGSIDNINGVSPAPMSMRAGAVLSVEGWAAHSVERGVPANAVYIALLSKQGKPPLYIKARATDRSDVARHFNQPALKMSGFSAYIDTSNMKGDYALGVIQQQENRLVPCRPLRALQFN